MYIKSKISTKNIDAFLKPHATNNRVLVIHSEDIDWKKYFPNAYTVTKRSDVVADLHVDKYYNGIDALNDSSFDTIICTGLLEHLPYPDIFVKNLRRILAPDGKLVLQASCSFSIHEGPDNFFQFTQFGFEILFKDFRNLKITGSCQPYETIAILLQRILYQADVSFMTKAITVILYNILPVFDKTIKKQYAKVGRNPKHEIDSMLPSNMQIVCFK